MPTSFLLRSPDEETMARWKRQAKQHGLPFAEYLRVLLDTNVVEPHASVSGEPKRLSLPQAPGGAWKGPDFKKKKQ